ncbi:AraC family transcriptional regulator [Leptospira ilyithenensis]|uniref:AraC family transcriptional regulator n=1 Tax=Leptospira ilyithenensis TaxID=2484901 RepID=A0A4R9LPG2_9LEPT|nr:AraC family transcriptional regulator [Leptospira ilyithenensis]TGN08704.1 AraC family transcriptional regulator [Leptospira ilyithenensis]
MDLLSAILDEAGWKNDLLTRDAIHESWGFQFPCEKSGGFHIITQGSCYARFLGKQFELKKGDILFISKGLTHELLSDPKAKVVGIQRFYEKREHQTKDSLPITTFVSVRYEIPERPQHPFFLELPDHILMRAEDIAAHHSLNTATTMISQELESGFGSDLILQRLTDILLYYVIRHWLSKHPSASPGWVMAFRDNHVILALQSMHKNPSADWTLESLAKNIGISRAGLANKFKEVLNIPPMEYLTRIRMDKARDLFMKEDTTLEEVALAVGYSSAFSFSKAYKRLFGVSPAREWKKAG